ncbi:MAG: TetR family transcriptional regulator [Nakamurella sp.]
MPVTSVAAPTVTGSVRRAQIIEAAIAVIAESGYSKASFARIATTAGLSSTRFISYHFKGKADLMSAVVADVLGSIGAHVGSRVAAETTATGMLRTYIEAVVDYIDGHRSRMIALTEIMLGAGFDEGIAGDQQATGALESMLEFGQRAGEFRDFDRKVMATTVQRSVDGLPFALQADPTIDCAGYASELVTIFQLATAKGAR